MKVSIGTICTYCKSTNCYFITPKKLFYICRSCRELTEPSNGECDYHGFKINSSVCCPYCIKIKEPNLSYESIKRKIDNINLVNDIRRIFNSLNDDTELFTEDDYD